MKVVLLAGGFGTRISEETITKPKPMVEIGGKPILWHIMKIYSSHGFNEFVICLGYKGYYIKEYFANYFLHQSDVTFHMKENKVEIHNSQAEPWKVTLVDTGIDTMTGGRVRRVKEYLNNDSFLLTYGDGVADINIAELVSYHKAHKKLLTVTAVQPSGRFGALDISENQEVVSFLEKPKGDGSWINGGFFVCQPEVLNFISDENTIFEKEPLENIAHGNQMVAYKHDGFWKPMDTLRDKHELENLWDSGKAPWKNW
jgi:glucose-1-phosphate cytidylyltransferase